MSTTSESKKAFNTLVALAFATAAWGIGTMTGMNIEAGHSQKVTLSLLDELLKANKCGTESPQPACATIEWRKEKILTPSLGGTPG